MATIYEIVSSNPNFSLLNGLIDAFDATGGGSLADALSAPDANLSLLAPTNDAVIGLANMIGYPDPDPDGASAYLTAAIKALANGAPETLLIQILALHVVPDVITEADLADPATTSLSTLLMDTVGVTGGKLVDSDPDTPDANVTGFEAASNGSVFTIDQVLLPRDLGADTSGSPQSDLVTGSALDDVFGLFAGDDVASGGDGDDQIDGGAGDDLIHGGAGNDVLIGGAGNDRLEGQTGKDKLLGGRGDDILNGDQGDDILRGGAGDDFLQGGSGDDFMSGNSGDDTMRGGTGDDRMFGRDGDDTMRGNKGDDRMLGGDGNDHINGGSGDDMISGGSGDDFVAGGVGDDWVAGNSGDDYVKGNTGDDMLIGGAGNDTYEGNDGADTFSFAYEDGANTVVDFTKGEDIFAFGALEEGQSLTFTAGQGDGDDLLITSDVNSAWSVLVLDTDSLDEDEDFLLG